MHACMLHLTCCIDCFLVCCGTMCSTCAILLTWMTRSLHVLLLSRRTPWHWQEGTSRSFMPTWRHWAVCPQQCVPACAPNTLPDCRCTVPHSLVFPPSTDWADTAGSSKQQQGLIQLVAVMHPSLAIIMLPVHRHMQCLTVCHSTIIFLLPGALLLHTGCPIHCCTPLSWRPHCRPSHAQLNTFQPWWHQSSASLRTAMRMHCRMGTCTLRLHLCQVMVVCLAGLRCAAHCACIHRPAVQPMAATAATTDTDTAAAAGTENHCCR